MNDAIVAASDDTLDSIVASGTVLVDFWADWCGPCKALAPTLDELAEDYRGEVTIAKVDVVANEASAERFGARTIPLLVLFKDGVEVDRMIGSASKTRLASFIEAQL